MDVEINLLAVLVAGVTTMITGYVWYAPQVFGNTWVRLGNVDVSKLNSKLALISAGVSLLLMAYGLAFVAGVFNGYFGHSFLYDTLLAAACIWGGFQALRMFQLAEFNQDKHLETAIHVGNEFVTIMIMAAIIGLWGQ